MTYHVVFVDQTRGFSIIGIYGQTAFSNFNYDVNSTRGRPSQNQFFLHYSHRKEFLEYLISGGESWVLYGSNTHRAMWLSRGKDLQNRTPTQTSVSFATSGIR